MQVEQTDANMRNITMWGRRKPDERQAAKPELKSSQRNQSPGHPVASLEGTMQLNEEAMRPTGVMKDTVASRLGANLHMKGEITGSKDLVIEGTFEGLVQLGEGKLTIGKTAKVTADIIVGEVLVYGLVKGNVRAKSRIEIKKDCSVDGDLHTAQIMIEDGAFFKGSIEIERSVGKGADGNMSSQTTSKSATQKATGAGARSKISVDGLALTAAAAIGGDEHSYENTVEPSRPKSAGVEQPVPQPKDARVPSFWLADTPQSPAEKDDEKQLVETSKASSGTQALRPQQGENSALSHAKEALLSIFKDLLFPKEKSPDFVSLHVTPTLFPTPRPPAKTSVNKRATPPPLLSLPTSSIKSIKVPRRLLRIAIAAAAIVTLFAAGRIAVQQHSQKTLKDRKASAALNSPATSEPKQRNETSAEISRRNLPTTWTQNIPQPPVTRNSPGQNANVRSPVPASEAVSNHQAVAPTPLAMTPTQILNYTEFSGRASHPPAESTRQAGPTPGVPTSSLEGKPVQTLESRPAQTGEGTTQSKDSNAASSPPNSSAVPAETSPTPIATDKETNAAPPKQPEASEPMPASGTVNPSASPASGTPTETKSKEPRGPERIQRGKLIMQVNPVYPKDAQRQGIEGSVKVHVVFSPEGTVTNVTFVSGPQALATAAMDAVRQWRYSPTLFDGKPVETEDEVTIRFRLAKSQRQGSKKDKDEDELM